jgi:hypothetical protein
MNSERRRTPRYQFISDAVVADLQSGTKFNAKTGDLSFGGCFLNMLNPSPEGAEVRVTIFHGTTTFTAFGRVVFVFPNMGMGIVFTTVEADQLAALHEWLSELSRGASIR